MTATWNRGSEWHRWDPHVHSPATLLANEYGGDWAGYFERIERSAPVVEALGITDYCSIVGYKEFLARRNGRAPNVKLVFPNVEFRLNIPTKEGRGINLHLLFSTDDPGHVREIERLLGELSYEYKGTSYRCALDRLVALGRAYERTTKPDADPSLLTDERALQIGVNQFKLSFPELREVHRREAWFRKHCIVAVAVKETDGTSGLRDPDGAFGAKDNDAFSTLREEIEAFAHVIFSGREGDRTFWVGQTAKMDEAAITRKYRSLKPCLHGSDAHRLEKVLAPDLDRRCWIRAEPTFEGLRQILIEPAKRAHVGSSPPAEASPSECISELRVFDAPWLEAPAIALNPGLVAIIGPKGSGKTALADLLAHAAGESIVDGASSFLLHAEEHLRHESAALAWGDGSADPARRLNDRGPTEWEARVRYLSQQSVERLCSKDGTGTELLREIEAVVFQSIPDDERLGAADFEELRSLRLGDVRDARSQLLEQIQDVADRIAREEEKKARIGSLTAKAKEAAEKVKKAEEDLKKLLPKDKKKELERLAALQDVLTEKERGLAQLNLRKLKLGQLSESLARHRERWGLEYEALREKYESLGLQEDVWERLRPRFSDDGDKLLQEAVAETTSQASILEVGDSMQPKMLAQLATWSITELREEVRKLKADIGIEEDKSKKHGVMQKKLEEQRTDRVKLDRELEDAKQAEGRKRRGMEQRRKLYAMVFDSFVKEEGLLEALYAPLKARLGEDKRDDEGVLEFRVRRRVDVEAWAARGEELLDLRRRGPLQGRDTLLKLAKERLLPAWETGDANAVGLAMEQFLAENAVSLAESKAAHATLQDVGRWLFSVDHVRVVYGIRYNGVEIARLSPGTRGIVLLMLYLAIDKWDQRPLVVDQPEENLDPESVYKVLVRYFREANRRRQIILVTHNPNLVVNADADQVIVASATQKGVGLPQIRYSSGGLEDPRTRADVCRILEGGERAFREREQRYAFPDDQRVDDDMSA